MGLELCEMKSKVTMQVSVYITSENKKVLLFQDCS